VLYRVLEVTAKCDLKYEARSVDSLRLLLDRSNFGEPLD
jgi:hypothetical protein